MYFCCLEALQNAGKHAGADAHVHIAVGNGDGSLWFEVGDDGAGFDAAIAGQRSRVREHARPARRVRRQAHGRVRASARAPRSGGTLPVLATTDD